MKSILTKKYSPLMAASFLAICGTIYASESHVDKIIAELNKADSDQVLVTAHRGDWRNHPENSINCVLSCIEMGVDIVELDVRQTKDGVFILMHDKTVNRTTNGKGKIAEMTFDEIRKLRLKHEDIVTDQQVPTLEEILNVAKGKIMINVDKAGISRKLVETIKKTGTLKQIVFKSGKSVKNINASIAQCEGAEGICFMPILKKGGLKEISEYLKVSIRPKAVELCFKDSDSPFLDENLIKELRTLGLRPWVNTLYHYLCAGNEDSKAVKNPDLIWGGLIRKGYNMIQTDNPKELLEYLHSKNLHKFDGRKPSAPAPQVEGTK